VKAIRVHAVGGPEAMRFEEVVEPVPKAGEAVVRVEAAGVNFIDTYHRTGLYKVPLPYTLGQEGAGTVEAVASDVSGVKPGDRVAWAGVGGSYAEKAVVPAAKLVKLPAGVSAREGAAAMLQGMTAHYLATSTYPLKPGDTCLVHAAAGGVGLLLCQIAKMRGARVIGTAGSEEKAKLARGAGADETIDYTKHDFEAEVKRITGGKGVQVVYDGVGKSVFEKSLNCLAPRGLMATFGNASGPVPPVEPLTLSQKGSLFLTRPTLWHYIATREDLDARAGDVLGWIASGRLKVRIGAEFPLANAAAAHSALEGRQTTGKVLLLP
jgi:NADPH2:quinone reductase